jgi:hypothetical protein
VRSLPLPFARLTARALAFAIALAACRDDRLPARPPLDPRPPAAGAGETSEIGDAALPAAADLIWHPQDFDVFFAADFTRLRALPLWREHLEPWLVSTAPATWAALRARCPFDPLARVRTLSASLVFLRGNLGATVIARGLEAPALFACLRDVTSALAADGLAVRWEEKEAGVSLTSRESSLGILGSDDTVRLTFNDVILAGQRTLRTSLGFHERMRTWDRRAALWFAIPGDSPIFSGHRASAWAREVVLTSLSGSLSAAPAPAVSPAPLDGARAENLLVQARLAAVTPERARAFAASAEEHRLDLAAFTSRLEISVEDRDVVLIAELPVEKLRALALGVSLPATWSLQPPPAP